MLGVLASAAEPRVWPGRPYDEDESHVQRRKLRQDEEANHPVDDSHAPSGQSQIGPQRRDQCENGPEEIHEVVVGDKCRQNL